VSARPKGTPPRRTIFYVLVILFALAYLGPFLIQLATSFKTDPDATSHSLSLIPHPFTIASWKRIFGFTNDSSVDFPLWLMNSTIVATSITLLRVFIDSLAGYALARLRFPGRQAVFGLVLATMSVPGVILLIPRFLIIKQLGIYNTYEGMIFPIAMDAMGIFLMRQFFLQVPVAIEEAARIDGAGIWRTFWFVAMPMAKPGLLVLTILSFQSSWNEFTAFLVAGDSPRLYTLTKGLALFQGSLGTGNQYPLTLGAALLTTVPVAVIFFVFQRQFTGAQLSAGVKG
jgi:multiple sugar transport system permease protein